MTLKELVLLKVDPLAYYKATFPGWHPGKGHVCCPFHDEETGSLSINLAGGGARCWGATCGKRIGNIVHFESELRNVSEDEASILLYRNYVTKIFDAKEPLYGPIIHQDMGLDQIWSNFFGLYYDHRTQRVEIPVTDEFGYTVAIRKYLPKPYRRERINEPKIYHEKGGTNQLFPRQCIKEFDPSKPVFFLKSEKCAMLAISRGLQAFCTTGGEGFWNDDWNDVFNSFNVYIWHDPGTDLARKLAGLRNSKVLAVPSEINGDFTEWVLKGKGTPKDMLKWALEIEPVQINTVHEAKEEIPEVALSSIKDYLDKPVKVKAIVCSKQDKLYKVPCKFEIRPTGFAQGKIAQITSCRDLLSMIKLRDSAVESYVKQHPAINFSKATVRILERMPITESMEIIPLACIDNNDRYVIQRVHYMGENSIEANVPYLFTMIPTTDSKTQEIIGMITEAETTAASIDAFQKTDEVVDSLAGFRSEEGEEWDKFCNVANDLVQYTRIRDRMDWHMCALLTWTSPLTIKLPHEEPQRGWLNTLALGDTHTGKSEVGKHLSDLFRCGEYASAENCTFVGLVGGTVKNASGQFVLRWGKIPINDRRLVILEEMSGLSTQDLSNLSDLRSSGIAKIDKGGLTGKVKARTRLLCISNVRARAGETKSLSSFNSGVNAIQKLVGQPEDISRFDLICTLVASDVSSEVINTPFAPPSSETTREKWQQLINFIWSLKEDEVFIGEKAHQRILDETKVLGGRYHPSVPIFNFASGRHKLARVATAIACALFNWDKDKRRIVVTAAHVECAVNLLKMLYDKPSMGYKAYSDNAYFHEVVKEDAKLQQVIRSSISCTEARIDFFAFLLHREQFSDEEIQLIGNLHMMKANEILHWMIRTHWVTKAELNLYHVTKVGKQELEKNLRTLQSARDGKNKLYGGVGINGTNGSPHNISRFPESGSRQETAGGIKFIGPLAHLDVGQDELEQEALES